MPELSWTRRQAVALVTAGVTGGGGASGYLLPPRTKPPAGKLPWAAPVKAAMANVTAASAPRSWVAPYGPRPLRLFSRPRSLHRVGRFLLEGGKRWRIVDVFGPERIQGEWWTEANCVPRDYYRIETENGDTLWIFRDGEGELYLHGIFE